MSNVLAIDIGGTHFRIGVFDPTGERIAFTEGDTLQSGGRDWLLKQIQDRARAMVERLDQPPAACGVSFGGPVDYSRQVVTSLHAPGWHDFRLPEWVEDNLRLPCRVDNDANAGALGEYRFGAGQGTKSLVYITLSTGVGAGLICDGKLYRGRDSLAGEVGHLPMTESGMVCSCGARGCLETLCSGTAIAQRGRDWAARRPESVLRMTELSGTSAEGITAKAVVLAAAEGDQAAGRIIREATRWLARAILSLIRILNPDKIILGGGVSQAGIVLLAPLREAIEEQSAPSMRISTELALADLGTYSPLYGAAAMAVDLANIVTKE